MDHNKSRSNFSPDNFADNKSEGLSSFNPSEFFIPGWKGEGLITASAIVIKNSLNNLTIDAQVLFKKSCSTSKSMKLQTYNEFLHFAQYAKCESDLLDCKLSHQNDFWMHVQDESSPLKKHIDNFFKIHSFRAVAIYLFRIKFIMDLAKELKIEINEANLINPLSFLGRIFVKDSSTELKCESLQINQYSWYRPSAEYKDSLQKLKESFENITLTELIKLISTPKDDKIYSLRNYSHSLSHLSFGLLVNELLIKFPTWIKPEQKLKNFSNQKVCLLPKTINTRFSGNHVASFALSHWLAQETNIKISQWNNLICPEFEGLEFIDGQFLKICQELQFLSFLTRIASEHKYEIVPFICKIMREKYTNSLDETVQQASFFNLGTLQQNETLFNRIVLNLTELPKVNPHHFLIQQIQNQKNLLKKDGLVFVFTNQKLFVPSHADRVEQLLKDFKVEACFNFEDLKGKGEIAHYVYILNKKSSLNPQTHKHLFEVKRAQKETCLSFEIKGDLSRFNKFNKIVEELQYFIAHKNPVTTPLYHNDIDPDISFEFHQDAIIEGRLVSSSTNSNKEHGHLPHPSFFKNLTRTCISLDNYFQIEMLSHENGNLAAKDITSDLLGVRLGYEKQYPLLLIINQNDPMNILLELVPMEAYRAKIEQYGTAFYYYFGLTPKHSSINLNVFREFFESTLGHQIIQLQLSDGLTKIKAKLKSLLVPSFFSRTMHMPLEIESQFKVLQSSLKELKTTHPEVIESSFKTMTENLEKYSLDYPWHVLCLLSQFKIVLKDFKNDFTEDKTMLYNFSNPLISNTLVKLKTKALYPKNPDVYIDYKITNPEELKLPLSSATLKSTGDDLSLVLKFHDSEIVHLHSNPTMIHFLKFVLSSAVGVKISDILMNLRIPALNELESATELYSVMNSLQKTIYTETESLIAQVLRQEISR